MQTVFRVPITSTTADAEAARARKSVFRARRSHKKSRTGCKTCKQRRIKCDENRNNGCLQCQSHGFECDYTKPQSLVNRQLLLARCEHASPGLVKSSDTRSVITHLKDAKLLAPLRILLPPVFNVDIPLQMTPVLQTLQHFDTVTYCSLGSEPAQVIIRSCMHTMIIENACLMHAVNGTSAAHLSYLVPAAQNAQQHRQSKLAAAYHWQKALQLFQDELSLGVNEKNMDALLSTMMLVCVYQFMLNESLPNPSESFVYAPAEKRQNCLQWLHIQHGFQALVTELGDRLRLSMWNPVLEDGEVKQTTRQFLVPPAGDEVHALFLDLCEISEKSSSEQNPFYTPLEHLLFFRRPEASVNKFTKLISFVGTVDERFHRLLLIREKRALLILAYWLAMMSELEQWWISRRARNECTAITAFLMSDPDEKVRKLLAYPARIMGMMDVSMKASLV